VYLFTPKHSRMSLVVKGILQFMPGNNSSEPLWVRALQPGKLKYHVGCGSFEIGLVLAFT
jgi:hypothetical protein